MGKRYRLIKPSWGKKHLSNGQDNPKFSRIIEGPDVLEGVFSKDVVKKYNESGYNVYYFPNTADSVSGNFLSGKEVNIYTKVFVDMDLKDEIYNSKDEFLSKVYEFPLKPSEIVDSGNGIHVYWNIEDLDRESFIISQFSLINYFKTDTSVWTPLQLMRVGGTFNTKVADEPILAKILKSSEELYTLDELFSHLEPPTEAQNKKLERHCSKLDGTFIMPEFLDIDFDKLPVSFISLLESNSKIRGLFQTPKEYAGDRSIADFRLAQELFSLEFDLSECAQILSHGLKAKSRADGREYAFTTAEKVYIDREATRSKTEGEFKLISELLEEGGGDPTDIGLAVNGAPYWDCLKTPWQTSQVLGIIAGPGVGKTETTLHQFKCMVESDPDSLFVFFSLEMPERQIARRWVDLIQGNKALCNNVIVVGNEDSEGMPRNLGIQDIYSYVTRIEQRYGKKVKTVVIDHINILDRRIDMNKKPDFRAEFEDKADSNGKRTMSQKGLLSACKQLAKSLDVFLIIQSQTTKTKAGNGDIALGLDAAYGNSAFEWYCDLIITLWQPLRLVQDVTELQILAWQYVKIREQSSEDLARVHESCVLKYDRISRSFGGLSDVDRAEFDELLPKVYARRALAEKNTLTNYKNSNILKALAKREA